MLSSFIFCHVEWDKKLIIVVAIVIVKWWNEHFEQLDPVGLTVRYEVMKLCMGQYEAVLPIPYWRLTDWQMSKDRAPQLFISVRVELS